MILDCTIRDGGYANNYRFSFKDIKNIVEGLNRCDIEYIEVGHGLGLGAKDKGLMPCFEDEFEQISFAKKFSNNSKIGSFFITNLGEKKHIKKAISHQLDFIRIGAEPKDSKDSYKIINFCTKNKLETHLNLMKTYGIDLVQFKKIVKEANNLELKYLYIVDSAGCMTPETILPYLNILKEYSNHKIGFHGHNNLGLANYNSLFFIKNGGDMVDATIGSMGRSAGNAQTEIIAYLLKKYNFAEFKELDLTLLKANVINQLNNKYQGIDTVDVLFGMTGLHSSYLDNFERITNKYDIKIENLIVEVAKKDNISPNIELIENTAKSIVRLDQK